MCSSRGSGFYKLIGNAKIVLCDGLEKKCLHFPEVKLVTRENASFSRETLSCNLLQNATILTKCDKTRERLL